MKITNKADLVYPLPPESLHRRYDNVFESIDRGQSVTLIGLPESSRSAYFKFITQNPKVISQFINPDKYKFVYIDKSDLALGKLGKSLIIKIAQSGIFDESESNTVIQESNLTDLLVATHNLCNKLEQVVNKKLVIVFYEAEEILLTDPEFILLLHKIWCVRRFPPNSLTNLVFICSPSIIDIKTNPVLSPLRSAFEESVLYFPLFDETEMNYHRKRIEYFSGINIENKKDKLIRDFADGHAVAYKVLSNLSLEELEVANSRSTHPSIQYLSEKLWASLPQTIKKDFNQTNIYKNEVLKNLKLFDIKGNLRLKFLPPQKNYQEKVGEITLPRLTAQERILYDFLLQNNDRVVSRDEVANAIWGKRVDEKYSDWAIDQVVHKLRKKLVSVDLQILTHRNRGYQLIENK